MTKQVIVTDSTSDLSAEYLNQHNIHVVPLNLTIDKRIICRSVDISSEEYIKRIEEDADVKTSQPSIGKFIELYEQLDKDNDDVEIFSIHMSSGLSGTYQTALQASNMIEAKVNVIDSKSISFGLAYQIQRLVELVNTNLSSAEIIKHISELQKNIKLFVVIGQLNQLIKGGRISKTKGLIGNIMKIKPIGTLREGYLEIVHNSRTQNSSIQYLKKKLLNLLKIILFNRLVLHMQIRLNSLKKVKHQFNEAFGQQNYDVNVTTPVISTHTGQGAIGLVVVRG